MSRKVITIAVPVYNVEAYLAKCLDSFCIPELSSLLEVLIINDGSTDTSPSIAMNYVQKYPAIFRLLSKPNGGHGSAINTGIANASGTYFKVVDGDDWVDSSAFCHLVAILQTCTCDIVASRYCWVDNATQQIRIPKHQISPSVRTDKPYEFAKSYEKSFIKMHNMTIRTELLKSHCPAITEHCFYVDNEFILFPIPYVKSILWIKDIVYMYRMGLDSQSVNLLTMQSRVQQHEHVLLRLLEYYDTVANSAISNGAKKYLASGIARLLCSQIKIYLSFSPNEFYQKRICLLEAQIRKNQPLIYHSVTNLYVRILRLCNYKLYYPASYLLRKGHGIS